ncbi:hypothetical protein ACFLT1_03215 [Bacteroidota bacterium]
MIKKSNTSSHEISKSQRLAFSIISYTFPLLLLLLLEGILRMVSYGDRLNLFIDHPEKGYEEYLIVNPAVGKKYFQKFEHDAPSNDIFLKEKTSETFRIVVMGSSTVVGFPYEKNLMFSRILHMRLEDMYPEKEIEVVNTAITAVNSYTLFDYRNQILKQEPDAILIYAGHNEFYGAFGAGSNESMSKSIFLTRLHLEMMDFRFYQLMRNTINAVQKKRAGRKDDQVHGTLMKRIVANRDIAYESELYKLAMERYERNMGGMLKKFTKKNIPVMLSEVVSNVKDIEPLCANADGADAKAVQVYSEAKDALKGNELHLAKELFYKAKDLDAIRFRASEDVNRIIRELGDEYSVKIVPMLHYFEEASPNGIIGNELMTEHVHPNINGSFLMAEAFYTELIESGIIGANKFGKSYSTEYYKLIWGCTLLDSLVSRHLVANLTSHWPFVPLEKDGGDYRLSYHPVSRIDSIAFEIFRNPEITMEDKRLELAEEYDALGAYYKAYKEYEAMLRTNPYLAINYRDAGSAALKLRDLPLSLKYYEKSLEYEKSFFARYRIGEIYIIKGDYLNARKSFEEAFELAENNEDKLKTLGKIYQSCIYASQDAAAASIADQLKKYNAEEYLKIPRKAYVYLNYVPYQTRKQVQEAGKLLVEGQMNEALEVLQRSLRTYDSHVVHRYIGQIYLSMKDTSNARYHYNMVFDEFAFDPNYFNELISLYNLSGEDTKAREALEKLRKLDPDHPAIEKYSGSL